MKTKFKKLITNFGKIMLLIIACFSVVVTATNAETAPKKVKISAYNMKNTAIKYPSPNVFHVKKTSDGKYVYCTYWSKTTPRNKVSFTRSSLITDNGINYILSKSTSAKNDKEFFIYQSALWVYMLDKGIMPGTHNGLSKFRTNIKNSTNATAKKIKKLVSDAKKASKNDTSAPTIKLSTSGVKFTKSGDYYVSSDIAVKSSTKDYEVKLTDAPKGTTFEKKSKTKLVIKVPASKVTTSSDVKVKFTVNNSKTVYKSYTYKPSNSKYQTTAITYKDKLTAKDSATLKINKKEVSLSVLKVDASTNQAIKGAGLQVLNSAGEVIDSWSSETTAHKITGLTAGTYTLKEVSSPKGYKLSKVKVNFTVNADGTITNSEGTKITEIKYTNESTSVTISKQDITSKAEVPGAHLVIKDSNKTKIVEWTSSDKKYVIKGLAEGTYTLTETIAPDGYDRSTETITFKLDKYGNLYNGNGDSVDYVVMYNEKTKETPTDVHISKSDITTSKEVPGAHLIVKNKNTNEVIDEWTSTEEDHIIKDLKEGTYTLTETIAPEGYIKSSETITFSINSKGQLCDENGSNISKVIMYNEKKPTTGSASISKQDATNGSELPGATLIVKDYDGNVIDTWVSTNEPHLIKNLKPGIYTLTETIAPAGYALSSETVTFTIKEDGSVTPVVMKNAPDNKETPVKPSNPTTPEQPSTPSTPKTEVPVESTGSFKTLTSSVIGAIIMVIGSLFITKNIKKNNA